MPGLKQVSFILFIYYIQGFLCLLEVFRIFRPNC